jgi:hypothetical protein
MTTAITPTVSEIAATVSQFMNVSPIFYRLAKLHTGDNNHEWWQKSSDLE